MSTPPRKIIRLPMVRMKAGRAAAGGAGAGIRITNVKSIRPPDPEQVRRSEEESLRAQLQKEIVSRSRSCAYKRYKCQLPVVWGRQHCARHVASDPAAPYAACAHERCRMPARKDSPDHQLCFEHARLALLSRCRAAAPPPPVTTTETLLHQLRHYVQAERARTVSSASAVSVVSEPGDCDAPPPRAVDPFKQIDARAVNAQFSSSIMECASASDSDADSIVIGGSGPDELCSPEGAPCEEQPLWHATVLTAEEAVGAARGTLRALQAAYRQHMRRLRARLQAARRRYTTQLRAEKEHYCSIHAQAARGPLSARERRQLQSLKAWAGYRRRRGPHAVLARKLMHRRAKVNESGPARVPSALRCTFSEGGVRCERHSLPAARHCLKHVLHDPDQTLFAACGDARGLAPCREPVPRLPLPAAACRCHTEPPLITTFTLKKDDSDSDSETYCSTASPLTAGGEGDAAGDVTDALP